MPGRRAVLFVNNDDAYPLAAALAAAGVAVAGDRRSASRGRARRRGGWSPACRSIPATRWSRPPAAPACAGSGCGRSSAGAERHRRSRSTATCWPCRAAGTRPCSCSRRRRAGCAIDRAARGATCRASATPRSNAPERRAAVSPWPPASPRERRPARGPPRCAASGPGEAPARAGAMATPETAVRRAAVAGAVPPAPPRRAFVDLHNDVTAADIALAAREGYADPEHTKRYTTLGMGTDQGKTGNLAGLTLLAAATGRTSRRYGPTTFRPPYVAGVVRRLGRARARPARRPGAGHADARLACRCRRGVRGCRAVEAAALLPASRRGHGGGGAARVPGGARRGGAARRLDPGQDRGGRAAMRRGFSTASTSIACENLAPGACRYGVMCREDGMVFDDGVGDPPRRRPVLADDDDRQCRCRARLAGGMAADRVDRSRSVLHLGDRAMGQRDAGRAARAARCCRPGGAAPARSAPPGCRSCGCARPRSPGSRRGSSGSASRAN